MLGMIFTTLSPKIGKNAIFFSKHKQFVQEILITRLALKKNANFWPKIGANRRK
jgi:hypothetical protein